ncbi:MAG: hypothetical protein BZY75_00975 [SAR202 cluster bacterium Io17-Chloro-G7]|nr:MAG: hypothetical protein BZY75_00975 [SAR202 cluster bacterium Io17-Chloro-G7]
MAYTADLHLHSSFAYACSKNLTLENISAQAKLKGIDLLTTADFTHPKWREDLRAKLTPRGDGLFSFNEVNFLLGAEVSCVYPQDGRSRRVHLSVFVPDFATVDRLVQRLAVAGNKLESDGRPTLKMSARDFAEMALDINPATVIIPAHVWTPWYGVFGTKSGFDTLAECFLDLTPQIHAIETGLSSDPAMIWPISELAQKTIVSFSDAHSPAKLGRELTVFPGEPSYQGFADALANQSVEYTLEFYSEEGKYHYSGHRKCGVRQTPEETQQLGNRCPVCGRPLTLGVLHRIASAYQGPQSHQNNPPGFPSGNPAFRKNDQDGFVRSQQGRPPFIRLVPLVELIAGVLGRGPSTRGVSAEYDRMTQELGSEFQILVSAGQDALVKVGGEELAQSILKARVGDVEVEPGYDGVYGKVRVVH